ncbi:MAG: PEP-utilizing enzyme [Microbacterium sp.]|uniref:PEP-utilizing enzyme n=1 Tax=unclassified Microbacterium TaxID=2609290 RepID=UPI0025EBE286|nr:PEP-utilizing enzyme [Microbacterium sp. UBA837]|tara:strand:- start:142 stop:1980 length:1839 start_codon:yes stop_codon:yes gene_type:complete
MSEATAVIAPVRNSFPSPYEQPAPAGAEGWKDLYAYNLVFQENRRELEEGKFWFCDSQHWPTVTKPFETIGFEFAVGCLGQYNSRQLLIPTANGIEYRIHNGYVFMSPVVVDPADIEARVPQFMERAGHYFQNWESLLENWHGKLHATIAELESVEFTALPDAIAREDVLAGKGTGPSTELLADYDRIIALAYRAWQYHFEFLNLGYVAYLDLFMFCKEVFPRIPDQAIATMVQGVDMELFRPDDELKNLAKIAVRDGLTGLFDDTSDAATTLAAIAAHPSGGAWMDAWQSAQDPWFNFTTGNGFYAHDEYWRDVPSIPLGFIAGYIERLQNGHDIDRHVADLVAERDRITEEYAEMLSGEVLETFRGKLGLARTVYPYVENHNFYIEHWTMGVFWRKARQLSKMLHEQGFWPEANDMFYLRRDEVREALFDYVNAWMVGAPAIGPDYWPDEIQRRRGIVDALSTARPQPALNTPPEVITEPFTLMLWGITDDQIQNWLGKGDVPEGTLKGMPASPGTAEGPARVISTADQLSEVQEGEILVAPVTAPSWGPIFGKIRATVTDIGGMMSHAAIVCREYGMPAVTGTGTASVDIVTGQMLRVDGTSGTVTILD